MNEGDTSVSVQNSASTQDKTLDPTRWLLYFFINIGKESLVETEGAGIH